MGVCMYVRLLFVCVLLLYLLFRPIEGESDQSKLRRNKQNRTEKKKRKG